MDNTRLTEDKNYIFQDELFQDIINFNELLLNNEPKSFVARVKSNKYNSFNIQENDIIVINVAKKLRNGNLVLIRLYDELIIKKYVIIDNEEYFSDIDGIFMPIGIKNIINYEIIGIISQSIHNF